MTCRLFPKLRRCDQRIPEASYYWMSKVLFESLTWCLFELCSNNLMCSSIEASIYGNLSTFCKEKILYRMRPVFRASLWPNQWSYSVPLGIKWKIWTLSFHWYPLVSFGFSGLDTKASQSQAFFPKVENAENWPTLLRGETQLFRNFFLNGCHS